MMSSDKLLDHYLELRTVLYIKEDDEVTLERYGSSSLELTSGDLSYSTIKRIQEEGFYFVVDNAHLVFMK